MLFPQHQAQLDASAISLAIAARRGYASLSGPSGLSTLKSLGFSRPQCNTLPGLLIPLWSVTGQRHAAAHFRPDAPRHRHQGEPIKYEYPYGQSLVLDCHPIGHAAIAESAVLLWITEGEKKADSLLSAGAGCVLCVLGVDGWRSRDIANPDFEHIALRNREVRLVYDSDIMLKRQVGRSLARLAQWLTAKGAMVWVVYLPSSAGEKIGVDDYLAAGHSLAEIDALCRPWESNARRVHVEAVALAPTHTPYGDLYNAEQFARLYGNDFRYCERLGGWFWWCGTHWRLCEQGEVEQHARHTMRQLGHEAADRNDGELLQHVGQSLKRHSHLTNMLADARSLAGFQVDHTTFDGDPWLLNCANGTLDLRTGQLRVHRREEMLTRCLPIAYDADAQAPRWEQFLAEIMGEPLEAFAPEAQELVAFLQRAVGYSLTGITREDCLFLLYGTGRNGKSVFLNTVRHLTGAYATQAQMETFLYKQQETIRNDLADLRGTRIVCAAESTEERRFSEGLIKQLTGGDPVKARFLRQEYFEFLPAFKIWLAFNHKPQIRGTDIALWERIHLVPFDVFIPEEKRDKRLQETLDTELPGILAWAVQGCLEWQKHGLNPPTRVRHATAQYRTEEDVVGAFLLECTKDHRATHMREAYKPTTSEVYAAYKKWAEIAGEYLMTATKLTRTLHERGFSLNETARPRRVFALEILPIVYKSDDKSDIS